MWPAVTLIKTLSGIGKHFTDHSLNWYLLCDRDMTYSLHLGELSELTPDKPCPPCAVCCRDKGQSMTMSLVSEGVFPVQVGKCPEESDPGDKCVGTGKVTVLLGWTVGLTEKVTFE